MFRFFRRLLAGVLMGAGLVLLLVVALCFTPFPWRAYAWLARDTQSLTGEPDVLVMLGGGGIPSESGLMRSYALAEQARRHPNALVAVAMPDTNDLSCIRMKEELVMRGISPDRIIWEDQGRNTREQALRLHTMLYADGMEPNTLLVTSPNHMKRALLTFRKAGFHAITGRSEFGEALTADLHYTRQELGGTAAALPDIGQSYTLRYSFWNNLHYQFRVLHELAGLAYYRVMGWI